MAEEQKPSQLERGHQPTIIKGHQPLVNEGYQPIGITDGHLTQALASSQDQTPPNTGSGITKGSTNPTSSASVSSNPDK